MLQAVASSVSDSIASLLDWLWSPIFPGPQRSLGVLLCVCTAFFAIRSVIRRKGTGPATKSEYRYWQSGFARTRLWSETAISLLYPFLLTAGACLVAFPLSRAHVFVLNSRDIDEQSAIAEASNSGDSVAFERSQLIDLGPQIDLIIDRVLNHQSITFPISRDDRVAREAINTIITTEMKTFDPVGFSLKNPVEASRRPERRMPSWLIESVEIACLRLAEARYRTSAIVLHTSGRTDRRGLSTWSDVDAYLATSGASGIKTNIFRTDGVAISTVEPVSAHIEAVSPTEWHLLVQFFVPGHANRAGPTRDEKVSIDVLFRDLIHPPKSLGEQVFSYQVSPTIQLMRLVVDGRSEQNSESPVILSMRNLTNGLVRETEIQNPLGDWSRVFRLRSQATTNNGVLFFNPSDPNPLGWFGDAKRLLNNESVFSDVVITSTGAADPSDIIIDTTVSNDGVWVYQALNGSFSPPTAAAPEKTSEPLQLRSVASGSETEWALDAFQAWVDEYATLPSAEQISLFQMSKFDLQSGTSGFASTGLNSTSHPIFPIAIVEDPRSSERSAVWIGIRAEQIRQRDLPRVTDGDAIKAAYWANVLRMGLLCLHKVQDSNRIAKTDSSRPIILLNKTDIESVEAETYSSGTILVLFGLLFATIQLLFTLTRL